MDILEYQELLKHPTLLYDTREQATEARDRRISAIGWDAERIKLNFGDYSVKVGEYSLADRISVERKMSLEELAMCFGKDRARFEREFERAKESGARVYLLVENASIDKIIRHQYKSKMTPSALLASLLAYQCRYDCRVVFADDMNAPRVIKEILYREAKELLRSEIE